MNRCYDIWKNMEAKNSSADDMSAEEARLQAQRIAFGPIVFQAARLLRDLGILKALRAARSGLTVEEVVNKVKISRYGLLVLLEAGLAAGLVLSDNNRYMLTKTGAYVLSDELTRINMNVMHHCCFQAMYYLEESIRERKPIGLHKIFGDWDTIYPALPQLPEPARTSWFTWDHYYSDATYPQALPIVFERGHRTLLDLGGNTGRWALQCVRYSPDVSVTILDLPGLVALAQHSIADLGFQARVSTHAIDVLDHSRPFPEGFDAIWMGQFLMCFAEEDVLKLLERAANAMNENATLYILDNFWDRQAFETGTYCLQTLSLYFTCLANGCSRMYKASDIMDMVDSAGLRIERVIDNLGICSSLMISRRR